MASSVSTSPLLLPVGIKSQPEADVKCTGPNIVGMKPLPYNIRKGELKTATLQSSSYTSRAAALVSYYYFFFLVFVMCYLSVLFMLYLNVNTKCAAAAATASQTLTRKDRSMTKTPDKVMSPKLDNNGPGLPPRDDDGNGGNGGGGGKFSGGLPFWVFLVC
ncbi:hypothetical protein ACSQ67_015583 [Phaseolus vulgaris]